MGDITMNTHLQDHQPPMGGQGGEPLNPYRRRNFMLTLWGTLAISTLLVAAHVAFKLAVHFNTERIGNGIDVESYHYDLSTFLGDRKFLVAGGMPKGHIRPLDSPTMINIEQAQEVTRKIRGKFLVPSDSVIGLIMGEGASRSIRAYPLRLLVQHEVINDEVAGIPIAVTYSPLSMGVVVFDRRVGGQTILLGHSGLLYQSNLLMYDRRQKPEQESLWSQLQMRAIAGPAARAGLKLTVLHAHLTTWGKWQEAHHDTLVMRGDPDLDFKYKEEPYNQYYNVGRLRFPADAPPEKLGGKSLMEVGAAIQLKSGQWLWRPWHGREELATALKDPLDDRPLIYAMRFAWQATHDESGQNRP